MVRGSLGGLLSRSLDAILPPLCVGCGAEGEHLCALCAAALRARLDAPPGKPIGLAGDLPAPLLQLEWCAPFTGSVRAAIHALKYDGARDVATTLGDAVAARWRVAGRGGDALVPVPVHAERLRDRGYDQAVLLAEAASRALELPSAPVLTRSAATRAQHALGKAARARNVGHRFEVTPAYRGRLDGRWLVLVDDVVTTGSTLSSCATALLEAGALAVSAVTVAREG